MKKQTLKAPQFLFNQHDDYSEAVRILAANRRGRKKTGRPIEVAPGIYRLPSIRDPKIESKEIASEVANKANRYGLAFERDGEVWHVLEGDELIATWSEASLPGLANWIAGLIASLQILAVRRREHSLFARKGGKKAVEKKRRGGASLSDRILKVLATEPRADTASLAERFQCDASLVRRLRRGQAKGSSRRD